MKVSFPAAAYLKPIKQWSLANGKSFWGWKNIKKRIAEYELFQACKN